MVKARSRALLTAGITLAVGTVVGGALLLTSNRQRSAADPATEVSAPTQGRQVAQALASLATDPQSLVAFGAARQVDGRARQAVPAGSKVVVDEKSWAPDGVGGGTIKVTVTAPGKPPVSYATVVVSENDRWKVLATFPLTTEATKSGALGASSP
jgi:hypothetical protein